ncbi:MAG: isocitrate dehydrogenase kinase/phosphatase AceK regulatory subunit, partial [Gammaproteobacteria bacterium]
MLNESHKDLIAESSQIIYDGFIHYNINFHRITKRAQTRFEQRDWKGHQQDIVDRVDLYEKSVRRIVLALRRNLGPRVKDHALWNEIRSYFGDRLKKVPDAGFIKTFFNSVTRRIFGTVGIDPQLEFVSSSLNEDRELIRSLSLRRYPYWGSIGKIFETILDDFSFRVPYSDLHGNAEKIASQIGEYSKDNINKNNEFLRFEFIDSFFYQSARAYLVGRIIMQIGVTPLVIAFKNTDDGII